MKIVTVVGVIALCVLALFGQHYYHKAGALSAQVTLLQTQVRKQQATIQIMTDEAQRVAQADAANLKKLREANAKIEKLHNDVNRGAVRLHVNARCPATPAATATATMADAATPRLTENAKRNYFRLREQIETIEAQVNGLQSYINERRPEGRGSSPHQK